MDKIEIVRGLDKLLDTLESDLEPEINIEVIRGARLVVLKCLQEEIRNDAAKVINDMNDKDLKIHFDKGFHEGYRQAVRDALSNTKIKVVKS